MRLPKLIIDLILEFKPEWWHLDEYMDDLDRCVATWEFYREEWKEPSFNKYGLIGDY